jgi:hypothetical protein
MPIWQGDMNSPYASGQQAEPNSSWFITSLCGQRGGVGADLDLGAVFR